VNPAPPRGGWEACCSQGMPAAIGDDLADRGIKLLLDGQVYDPDLYSQRYH
jgi:hypothetical protein